jgi:hypothetical protein
MPFDWNSYFTLAEELANRDDEASKRTSVSRAYYAAFHDAMIRVERNFGAKQGGTSHDWCWNKYMYSRDESCYQIAINGNRLKAKRVKADYDAATIERLTEYVARAIEDARRLKQQIAALDAQYPRP